MRVRHIILGLGANITAEETVNFGTLIKEHHGHGVDEVQVTITSGPTALTWVSEDGAS